MERRGVRWPHCQSSSACLAITRASAGETSSFAGRIGWSVPGCSFAIGQLRAPPRSFTHRASCSHAAPAAGGGINADANPLVLMLPRLSHSAPPTALDLERLSFKRVLLARHPDVHHTSVTICGKPIGQTLQEAPDSVGDAEECFAKITRGGNREEELRAEDEDARIVQVMAVIAQQCERIRMEAEEEAQSALHASQADLEA